MYSASSLVIPIFNFFAPANIFACESVISNSFLGIEVDASYLYLIVNSGGHRMNRHVFTTT